MTDREKLMPAGIPREIIDKAGFMDLDTAYQKAVEELGIQQSKRDQIIGSYSTVFTFLVPLVLSLDLAAWVKGVLFCVLYGMGVAFCFVILRYRIYKECYWIACRVITQLNHIKAEERSMGVIRTLYFHALKKNCHRVVVTKENKNQTPGQPTRLPRYGKTFFKQLDSAETLLFETLVVVASLGGCVGIWFLWQEAHWMGCGLGTIILGMFLRLNYEYTRRLASLYECVYQTSDEMREKTLNNAFNKAWMLHCSVDDILVEDAVAVP